MGTALIRYGEEGDLAAKIVAQHVPGATLRKDGRAGTSVDVVIGNAYTALVPKAGGPGPGAPTQAGEPHGRPSLRVADSGGAAGPRARPPARPAVRGQAYGQLRRTCAGTMGPHDRPGPAPR